MNYIICLGSIQWTGILYGFISSIIHALNGIFSKKYLHSAKVIEKSETRLFFVTQLNASILSLPMALAYGDISHGLQFFTNFSNPHFCLVFVAISLLSIAILYVTIICINLTSPLTYSISSKAKDVLQTLIGIICCVQGGKSHLWWLGTFIVLTGSLWYASIRRREMIKTIVEAHDTTNSPKHVAIPIHVAVATLPESIQLLKSN